MIPSNNSGPSLLFNMSILEYFVGLAPHQFYLTWGGLSHLSQASENILPKSDFGLC